MEKKVNLFRLSILLLFAVMLPFVFSCTNDLVPGDPDQQELRPTMIDPWTAIDQSPYAKEVQGSSSLKARFIQTKSHLVMNGENNFGKVVWDPGDSFMMYTYNGGFTSSTYTTTSGGEVAEFSGNDFGSITRHSIHAPSMSIGLGHDASGCFFGLNVPQAQIAVANKVSDNYLLSYAQSYNQSDNLTFKNILALVRFKISGAIVSSGNVNRVTLTGASVVAGDFIIMPSAEGNPVVSLSKQFTGDTTYTSINLTGSFAADTYYYFAVIPGVQSGFSLEFSGEGGKTTFISPKTVNFEQGKIADLGIISLGDEFADDPANPNMNTIKYIEATAGAAKPVTIAVIPDGFTNAEMGKYEMLAKSAINTLFSVEPFKSYKDYFNVYILKVASHESGARITDGTTAEQNRDCYFVSKWAKNSYDNMEANADSVRNFVTRNCPDIINLKHTIYEVPVLIIINDTRYGGRCHTSSSGFGYCMAPYTYSGSRLTWYYPNIEAKSNSDPSQGAVTVSPERKAELGENVGNWLNTMVHEFGGHCFGRLADEYWYNSYKEAVSYIDGHRWDLPPYYGVPYGLNISASYTQPGYDDPGQGDQYIKQGWQHLIDQKASLVLSNPLYNRIGVYQGGEVSVLNRWRSEEISCMIDNRYYFSTFQRELIVRRIMTLAGESFSESSFWAKDVATDPVRDNISSAVMGSDPVMPRPVPLLPPPVLHTDW